MITPLTIKNITFGEGMPKICIPITGHTKEEILASAESLSAYDYDVTEWRMDYYDDVMDSECVLSVLKSLREIVRDKLLLVTFRTDREGGEKTISTSYYKHLNLIAAKSGCADLTDIELFTGDDIVKNLVEEIHEAGVCVIMSNHDFHKTPAKNIIMERLVKMQTLGADLAKIAVMPEKPEDVLTLLSATIEMNGIPDGKPVISMSMGNMGIISRLSGSVFGSAMTFGAAGKASAPGQIDAHALHDILRIIHNDK